jgi:hypothetical protein
MINLKGELGIMDKTQRNFEDSVILESELPMYYNSFEFKLYNAAGTQTVGIDSNGDAQFTGSIIGGTITGSTIEAGVIKIGVNSILRISSVGNLGAVEFLNSTGGQMGLIYYNPAQGELYVKNTLSSSEVLLGQNGVYVTAQYFEWNGNTVATL